MDILDLDKTVKSFAVFKEKSFKCFVPNASKYIEYVAEQTNSIYMKGYKMNDIASNSCIKLGSYLVEEISDDLFEFEYVLKIIQKSTNKSNIKETWYLHPVYSNDVDKVEKKTKKYIHFSRSHKRFESNLFIVNAFNMKNVDIICFDKTAEDWYRSNTQSTVHRFLNEKQIDLFAQDILSKPKSESNFIILDLYSIGLISTKPYISTIMNSDINILINVELNSIELGTYFNNLGIDGAFVSIDDTYSSMSCAYSIYSRFVIDPFKLGYNEFTKLFRPMNQGKPILIESDGDIRSI